MDLCPAPNLSFLYTHPWVMESSEYSVVHQIHWFYFKLSPNSLLPPLLSALVWALTVMSPLICKPGHLFISSPLLTRSPGASVSFLQLPSYRTLLPGNSRPRWQLFFHMLETFSHNTGRTKAVNPSSDPGVPSSRKGISGLCTYGLRIETQPRKPCL